MDESADLLSTEARLYPVAPDGQRLPVLILQLRAATDTTAAFQQDPTVPPHLQPQVAELSAALERAVHVLLSEQ